MKTSARVTGALDAALAASTYAEFASALRASGCDRCPSLCATRNSIVVDRGNPSARILIVGEAPGQTEDREGRAFVGRSGKVLDEIFLANGLDTNRDAIIVNVVKCRPPDNRPPKPEEARNCRPFLERQMSFLKPRVVVLLGATAARHLAPDDDRPMKDRVGKIFELQSFPGTAFQILYHPAFLLRDPRRKPETREHVARLREWIGASQLSVPNLSN